MEYENRQLFLKYKYISQSSIITGIIIFMYFILKEYLNVNFENDFDYYLFSLGIFATYNIFKLLTTDYYIPNTNTYNNLKKYTNLILFILVFTEILLIIKQIILVDDNVLLIFKTKFISSDFIITTTQQFIVLTFIIAFLLRKRKIHL